MIDYDLGRWTKGDIETLHCLSRVTRPKAKLAQGSRTSWGNPFQLRFHISFWASCGTWRKKDWMRISIPSNTVARYSTAFPRPQGTTREPGKACIRSRGGGG